MNQNTKSCIEELKQIVMALHRSAANLDGVIMDIENEMYGRENSPTLDNIMYIAYQMDYRMTRKGNAFGDLDKRETDAWNKLIEAINKET